MRSARLVRLPGRPHETPGDRWSQMNDRRPAGATRAGNRIRLMDRSGRFFILAYGQQGVTVTVEYCGISFFEKLRQYSDDYFQCCRFLATCREPEALFTKKFYSKLVASSHLVEDFLDFHGAKNNKNWYLFREMSAAVRHLSMAAYIQEHISNRLVFCLSL